MACYTCNYCGTSFKRKPSESKGEHHFCNMQCYTEWRKGRKRENYDYKHTQEWKDALSKRMEGNKYRLGISHTEETKEKIRTKLKGRKPPNYGKVTPQSVRDKISKANKGKKRSDETKLKMSQNHTDISNPNHPIHSREAIAKMSKTMCGSGNPNWHGGVATRNFIKDYGMSLPKWNKLATKIRKRDNHICQYCGESNSFVVHHIFPRRIEIDNHPDNLITLCSKCHPKVEILTNKYIEQNRNPIEIFYDKWSK